MHDQQMTSDSHADPSRQLAAVINRLVASTETLAALTVHLGGLTGELELEPETARRVAALADTVVDLDGVDPAILRTHGAMGRAMLAQAKAFAAMPGEPGAWAITDPLVLQTLGRGSSAFASQIVHHIAPAIPGFAEAITDEGARVLDVGVGVGALAIEFARHLPSAHVVGLDVWHPAIELARANVDAASLGNRVEIRDQDVATFEDADGFDLVWFAGPFIPGAVQPIGIRRCVNAMRPGAWLVYGAFGGGDALTNALGDLRTLRSGGPVLTTTEIEGLLRSAGLVDVQEAPVLIGIVSRTVVGRKPG